jgi:23S rRNA (cytidine2498-2'-O)-methyltransferase
METLADTGLLLWCRAGFEPECAQEIQHRMGAAGLACAVRTERGTGRVRCVPLDGDLPVPDWRSLVYARAVLRVLGELRGLDPKDRLGPTLELAGGAGATYAEVWVEAPDSESGEDLRGLARGLEAAALAAMRKRGLLDRASPHRLHLCLASGTELAVASARIDQSAPWPGGIPRLKLLREAPSRSALKIEEAWLVLLDEAERERMLRPGMVAVDLGAAPGGWTWQLARRGLRVTAIDNGPLAPHVLAMDTVEHLRADGFRYRPRTPVDWVVCDMVEQPVRVATLMAEWLAQGHARAALFNLKLPMKKRWEESQRCLGLLQAASARHEFRARQLYHDREEITVVAMPTGARTTR